MRLTRKQKQRHEDLHRRTVAVLADLKHSLRIMKQMAEEEHAKSLEQTDDEVS